MAMSNNPMAGETGWYGSPGPWVTGAVIELDRMLIGTERTACSEMARITSGTTNTTPTKAAMAAAVLRKINPKPNDIRDNSAMNAPVITTARRAPGDPRLADGAPPPERTAWPRKNDT